VLDPFDLKHNLTRGIKPEQFLYILDRMECYRRHLRHVAGAQVPSAKMAGYMLEPTAVQGNFAPPVDVLRCYQCQKTGHLARDCKVNK